MAYSTEDTPYNKSTATSLSDLSVIDDDDDCKSGTPPSGPYDIACDIHPYDIACALARGRG